MKVTSDKYIYKMSPDNQAIAVCSSGDQIVFETQDCFSNQIQEENKNFDKDLGVINPATGPVKIEGAKPGDVLKIEIREIEVADYGVMLSGPDGLLADFIDHSKAKLVPIKNNQAVFNNKIKLPIEPMVGVIGTAPRGKELPCERPGVHGGNMDSNTITVGSTLYLPVWVEGGLLAIGDLHAIMKDGELGLCGIEVPGEVTVKVDLISNKKLLNPMVEDGEFWYTIASAKQLKNAIQQATSDMFKFLSSRVPLSNNEVYMLMSLVCDLEVCQVINSRQTVRVKLAKKGLSNYKLEF